MAGSRRERLGLLTRFNRCRKGGLGQGFAQYVQRRKSRSAGSGDCQKHAEAVRHDPHLRVVEVADYGTQLVARNG